MSFKRSENTAVYTTTQQAKVPNNPYTLLLDPCGGLVMGNSDKPSFSASAFSVAPTTSTWNALTIEQPASPTKVIYIKRLVIWNPGAFTTAQTTAVSLIRSSTASSVGDGALAVLVRDPADTATAVGRVGTSTSITLGTTGVTAAQAAVWSPATTASFSPVIIDFATDHTSKGIIVPKTALAGVVLRVVGAAGGTNMSMSLIWTEELA